MPDGEYVQYFDVQQLIKAEVGGADDGQFAGAVYPARPSFRGEQPQAVNSIVDLDAKL